MAEAARDHLIVALDVPEIAEARAVVDELGDAVTFYKLGPHLFVSGLVAFITELVRERRKRVFLDFKSFDIGETVRAMTARAAKLGVELMTVARGGSTIAAAREGREGAFPKILFVTLLTDQSEGDMQREFNTGKSLAQFVAERAGAAAQAGADGVVCSPREIAVVRDAVPRRDFLIVTPGVRPAGSAADDQKRIATPGEAIAAGADYLVVGRPIVKAPERRQAAGLFLDEIEAALRGRMTGQARKS